jgi:hypothetical protein
VGVLTPTIPINNDELVVVTDSVRHGTAIQSTCFFDHAYSKPPRRFDPRLPMRAARISGGFTLRHQALLSI